MAVSYEGPATNVRQTLAELKLPRGWSQNRGLMIFGEFLHALHGTHFRGWNWMVATPKDRSDYVKFGFPLPPFSRYFLACGLAGTSDDTWGCCNSSQELTRGYNWYP
jgi:hypothetical protein